MFEWIVDIISRSGYLGVAFLMFLENVFPPIPSELIMPMAGFAAARGSLSLVPVIIAGVVGSMLGALPWYYAGRLLGAERLQRWADRHGRWLTVSAEDVGAASSWFARHGGAAVLLGRLVPAVRTLISVPAGIARMELLPFLALSALGTLLWTGLLAVAGYLLEAQYATVAGVIDPASKLVVAGIAAAYFYRLVRHRARALPRSR